MHSCQAVSPARLWLILWDTNIKYSLLRAMPPNCQIVLFSATFPAQVVGFANKFAPNANQITLKHEELTVDGIKQLFMDCNDEDHKYQVLVELYQLLTIGSSIIFVKVNKDPARMKHDTNAE